MDANGIIGREYEQKLILERCKSNKAELIAIYGRRRVGKTFLVRKMFNDQFAFSFIGMYEVSRAVQLEQFRMALAQYAKQTVPKLKTWFEAFAALREYLSGLSLQEPIVLFFDELPWMDTPKSNFIAAFSYFWNSWASMVPQLKLIVCGSSTTWMLAKFIGDKGGLYGRVTRQLYLAPFSLGETELFLNELKGLALTRQLLFLHPGLVSLGISSQVGIYFCGKGNVSLIRRDDRTTDTQLIISYLFRLAGSQIHAKDLSRPFLIISKEDTLPILAPYGRTALSILGKSLGVRAIRIHDVDIGARLLVLQVRRTGGIANRLTIRRKAHRRYALHPVQILDGKRPFLSVCRKQRHHDCCRKHQSLVHITY